MKKVNNMLYKKNTALGLLLLLIQYFVFPLLILFGVIYLGHPFIKKLFQEDVYSGINLFLGIFSVPIYLTVYFLYKKRFGFYNPETPSFERKKICFIYLDIMLGFFVINSIFLIVTNKPGFNVSKASVLSCLGSALLAGLAEEIFFRGIIISYLITRFSEKQKCNLFVLFVSSILFAVLHLLNLHFDFVKIIDSLQQILAAFCFGIFLGSLYLKTGHLWPCVLIHFSWDFYIFISNSILSGFESTKMKTLTLIIYLLFDVFMGVFGYLMIKKGKVEIC